LIFGVLDGPWGLAWKMLNFADLGDRVELYRKAEKLMGICVEKGAGGGDGIILPLDNYLLRRTCAVKTKL